MADRTPIIVKIGQAPLRDKPKPQDNKTAPNAGPDRHMELSEGIRSEPQIDPANLHVEPSSSSYIPIADLDPGPHAMAGRDWPLGYRSRYPHRGYPVRGQKTDPKSPFWWSLPAGIGIAAGALLGFALLLLFRSVSIDSIGVGNKLTVVSASKANSKIELPGYSVWVYQVGSFQEQALADRLSESLKAKGIRADARGTGPIQLIAGVAGQKPSGTFYADLLKQKQVDFYGKPISESSSALQLKGVSSAEADNLKTLVEKMLSQAKTAVAAADSAAPAADPGAADPPAADGAIKMLQNAGYSQASGELNQMAADIQTVQTTLKTVRNWDESSILAVQKSLADFYTGYDKFILELEQASK